MKQMSLGILTKCTTYCLFFVNFCICPLVFAEGVAVDEKDKKNVSKMEEIVVTATRTEKELEDVPGSVAVITKADMEKRNIKAVDDALNTTAGVYYSRGKDMLDTTPRITLGGITGYQRTLILMDGITMNNAYTGNVAWNLFTPENVERIEVVKGPFSSLYGGYAMGGVVNIITKMPEKREFTLKGGYGSAWSRGEAMNDVRTYYASCGDKIEKLGMFLSYANKYTNGYVSDFNVQTTKPTAGITGWSYTTNRSGTTAYLIGDKGNNGMWADNVTAKMNYDFTAVSKIRLSYGRSQYNYWYDTPNTYLRDAAGRPVFSYGTVKEGTFVTSGGGTTIQDMYSLQYETEVSPVNIKFNLSAVDTPSDFYVTPTSSTAKISGGPGTLYTTPARAYNVDLQFDAPLFKGHIVTLGGSYRNTWANQRQYTVSDWKDERSRTRLSYQAKGSTSTYAVFFQDEIAILRNLTAYIGGRQDWWEACDGYVVQADTSGYPKNYGSNTASSFSPKAAVVYKPFEGTTLRTSAGRAFRPPTVYELYVTTVSSGITYASNPNLKPEIVFSWDVGAEQTLWSGAKAKVRYFENHISDLIYSKTTSATLQDKVNVGRAESTGVELEMEQRFDKWLRLFANFTNTDARITRNSANPNSVGKKMIAMPDIMFNAGGDFEKGPLGVTVSGRYVSGRYNTDDNSDTAKNVTGAYDPYFTVDGTVRYKITSWATASFSVNNIFNEQYYAYYLAPGRSWFLDLTLKY